MTQAERRWAISDAIKAYRLKHGMTKRMFAERCWVTPSTITRWENAIGRVPERVLRDIGFVAPEQAQVSTGQE